MSRLSTIQSPVISIIQRARISLKCSDRPFCVSMCVLLSHTLADRHTYSLAWASWLLPHPSSFTWLPYPSSCHEPVSHSLCHHAGEPHLDPATTASAEADAHLVANSLLANLAQVMCTGHYEEGVHLALKYTPCFEVWL